MDKTESASTALTTSKASAILADVRADARSWFLRAKLDSLSVTSGGSLFVSLCTDSGGDEGLTEEVEGTIYYGRTTSTDGWAVFALDGVKLGVSNVYVEARLSGGTGNAVFELTQG